MIGQNTNGNMRVVLLLQVLLLTDRVRFTHPVLKLIVHIRHGQQTEMMHVIARRERFDAAKARIRATPRKDDVAIEPLIVRCNLRERHAHLKRDACLLWQDDHWSAAANRAAHGLIDGAYDRTPASKMMREVVTSTRVRLIAVGEAPPAARTRPQRALGALHWAFGHHLAQRSFASTALPFPSVPLPVQEPVTTARALRPWRAWSRRSPSSRSRRRAAAR